jgi:uncharacterized membrane protein
MRIELEEALLRWTKARLIDAPLADRIREFEQEQAPVRRARWPVIAALAFGGVMLAAGVLLFVSAHWEELSPVQRMSVLVGAVAGFHVAGAFALERFRALGVTLHAAGTVSLGGAIALAGQIFNMQEHWPTAILLWALGALAGWLLLGDWPQLALAAILIPAWLMGEWTEFAGSSHATSRVLITAILLLAICYLSVRRGNDRGDDYVRVALAWIGGLALLPATLLSIFEHGNFSLNQEIGSSVAAIGWTVAIALPLAIAAFFRRGAVWMNGLAVVWVWVLGYLADQRAELPIYAWCALGAAGLTAWGIYEYRAERINLGMAGFAITVVAFFFSSVMDRLGRSASLIGLGILFVAGGWQWEKLRRRLVTQVRLGGMQ